MTSFIYGRSSKLRIGLQHEKGSEAFIDLEALSGFTEFSLEIHDNILPRRMATFGMYLQPVLYDLPVPSQVVLIVPRYVFSNESATAVAVRQCFIEVLRFCSDLLTCLIFYNYTLIPYSDFSFHD